MPTTHMSIFILFVSAGVLFEGTFSLWVSLKKQWAVASTSVSYSTYMSFNEKLSRGLCSLNSMISVFGNVKVSVIAISLQFWKFNKISRWNDIVESTFGEITSNKIQLA